MASRSWTERIKSILLGSPLNVHDPRLFHKISLIAFLAWIGLGADGISSSCYGPEEMFLALKGHQYLAVFVAAAAAITIFVISASYSQIIELFPRGGGGYLVASKLLSPSLGMVSGCALLVDYVLTITISVASGSDALFSFLPPEYQSYKILFAISGVAFLTWLNLRGVKESILVLTPIFIVFLGTHIFAILYVLGTHVPAFPSLASETVKDISGAVNEIGAFGVFILIMHAYSMGAGTFTGIEAVSNSMQMLREPRVETGKRTMGYIAVSLAFIVMGLVISYLIFRLEHEPGKTLNAVLFERLSSNWSAGVANSFVMISLLSETALLFVAAQAGFMGGPSVLANMAVDRWMPASFATLSERFVVQKGTLLMGTLALIMMLITAGSVRLLVVLYSITVFITFVLSQAGMVRHWWQVRAHDRKWGRKLFINGIGLALCLFILTAMTIIKFNEGGWATILVTTSVVILAILIRRHYQRTRRLLARLDALVEAAAIVPAADKKEVAPPAYDPRSKTAVVLVNGYNGLGLHTLFGIIRLFGDTFKNFVFFEVGQIDAGNFKGADQIEKLDKQVRSDLERYVKYMQTNGYYAESRYGISHDVVDEIATQAPEIAKQFANSVFFGGQLVFPEDTFLTRMLHSYNIFALQRRLYQAGLPLFILPIRV